MIVMLRCQVLHLVLFCVVNDQQRLHCQLQGMGMFLEPRREGDGDRRAWKISFKV